MASDDKFVIGVELDFSHAEKQMQEFQKKNGRMSVGLLRPAQMQGVNAAAATSSSVGMEFTKMAQAVRITAGLFRHLNDSMKAFGSSLSSVGRSASGRGASAAATTMASVVGAPKYPSRTATFAMSLPGYAQIAGALSRPMSLGVSEFGKREKLRTDLGTLLRSDEAGAEMASRIQKYAGSTPYSQNDLAGTAKMLIQYGSSMDEAEKMMKQLGDIAMGNGQAMSSLGLVLGQVKSAGKLQGQDLMQFINAGFNPLKVISEQTGKSMAVLKDEMSKGAISFEMVAESLRYATSEGGQFYKGAERGSKTLQGLWSTIQDNFATAMSDIVASVEPDLKALAQSWASYDWKQVVNAGRDISSGLMKIFSAASAFVQEIMSHAEAIKQFMEALAASAASVLYSKAASTVSSLASEMSNVSKNASGLIGTINGLGKTAIGAQAQVALIAYGLENLYRLGMAFAQFVGQKMDERDMLQKNRVQNHYSDELRTKWDAYRKAKKDYGNVDNEYAKRGLYEKKKAFEDAAKNARDIGGGLGLTQAMKEELGWAEKTMPKGVEDAKGEAKISNIYAPTTIKQENNIRIAPDEMGNIVKEYLTDLLRTQMNFTADGSAVRGLA